MFTEYRDGYDGSFACNLFPQGDALGEFHAWQAFRSWLRGEFAW